MKKYNPCFYIIFLKFALQSHCSHWSLLFRHLMGWQRCLPLPLGVFYSNAESVDARGSVFSWLCLWHRALQLAHLPQHDYGHPWCGHCLIWRTQFQLDRCSFPARQHRLGIRSVGPRSNPVAVTWPQIKPHYHTVLRCSMLLLLLVNAISVYRVLAVDE